MEIVHIDELTNVCGYFTNRTDANNHYGCNHPDQDEFEMMYRNEDDYTSRIGRGTRVKQGMCYSWSCPLATECDLQDLKEHDPERYDEWKDVEFDPSEAGANLVLVSDEELVKKLEQRTTS